MKKIITLLIISFCFTNAKAQTDIDTALLNNVLQYSPTIFEGTVIEQCTYRIPSTGLIYTNNIIKIHKLVKGQLECGTVSVITQGGRYQNYGMDVSHHTQLRIGFTGIFVCRASTYPNPYNCTIPSNSGYLQLIVEETALVEYFDDQLNEIAEGYRSQFHTLQDLYDFIQTVSGYTIVDCDQEFNFQNRVSKSIYSKPKRIEIEDETTAKKTRSTLLKYTLSAPTITNTGNTNYCEFDARVESTDSSTYLDEGAFRIKFNTLAFGVQIANNVQVTLGNDFDPATYSTIQKINKSDSVVSIWVHQATSPYNRTNVTPTKKILVHLKIPFTDCIEYPELSLDTFATVLTYSYFTSTSNATSASAIQYDSVSLNSTRQGLNCQPTITSLTSLTTNNDTTSAGIFDQVEIKGRSFGSTIGKLYLPNANKGISNKYTKLDNYDIDSWNDSIILFTLHSKIDSGFVDSTSAYIVSHPGSGKIRIINQWNAVSDSVFSKKIRINYSVKELSSKVANTFYKNNQFLFSPYWDSAYTFQLNSSITNPDMINCIQTAINHWRCLTGVNFKLDTNPISDTSKDDNINIITMSNNMANAVASTSSFTDYCTSTSNPFEPIFPTTNIDIKINNNYLASFQYDTTNSNPLLANKFDFYQVILHELGHALGLDHIIDTLDVMYYTVNFDATNNIPASSRRTALNFNNQSAGDYIMYYSTNLAPFGLICNNALYPTAMQDTSCRVFPLGISNHTTANPIDVNIYPNPFTDNFNIDLSTNQKIPVTCDIYDMTGKIVYSSKLTQLHNSINITGISKGIYLIKLNNNKQWAFKKVICIK